MKTILITGGAGFIGSNFVRYMLNKYSDYRIINVDSLTYAGNLANLHDIDNNSNYRFYQADISDRKAMATIFSADQVNYVINFAAETHVDRSIVNPDQFISTNIMGTQVLLDEAKKSSVTKYVQISTDEVYGSLGPTGLFTEESPIATNSPYSASKAGADMLVRAYHHTYNLPVNITRCSNNYGPYQFPEKLIPLMITNALEDRELPVYGDGLNIRDWLHVIDHCRAIDVVIHQATPGEIYNIGGNNEKSNIDIIRAILELLHKPESLIRYVRDRLGHDRRYAIDASKINRDFGWKPAISFEQGLKECVKWYVANPEWWQNIKSGKYRQYYQEMYGGKQK